MNPGELHVWRVRLDDVEVPAPTPGELARAAHLRTAEMQRRYLKAHGALRAILARETEKELIFAVIETGKPYLPDVPWLKFNLSHSGELALVAVARDVEVGVDVEQIRPMHQMEAIADRFFPPSEAAELLQTPEPELQPEFFRRWTRIEAVLKARGVGLYGAGTEVVGDWTIEPIDAGPGYAAAVAAPQAGLTIQVHDF
jgi:4'-phosphopantetheinyl transferase